MNWVALVLAGTYERPYKPLVGFCFIKGPVFFAPNEDGVGGIFVSRLVAEGMTERGAIVYFLRARRMGVELLAYGLTSLGKEDHWSCQSYQRQAVIGSTSRLCQLGKRLATSWLNHETVYCRMMW